MNLNKALTIKGDEIRSRHENKDEYIDMVLFPVWLDWSRANSSIGRETMSFKDWKKQFNRKEEDGNAEQGNY